MTASDRPVDFFDASALIKRYAEETGTDVVERAFDHPNTSRVITDIAIIEFHSAFARRMRMPFRSPISGGFSRFPAWTARGGASTILLHVSVYR